ncbi:MAG TPA: formate dehydrogenase accessory sulfurtransferase FdhD [Ignavibacteria bacterium]|nr:formate dehydrogenase accessory sulfurtransferase FdhD [Ignavibacteria bacterium]HMR41640.1 formate dehydrogenase accessory sulfurtransferase FdhD [Ignavibacteria bacterium]
MNTDSSSEMLSSVKIEIKKFNGSDSEIFNDTVAVEEPLEIRLEYGKAGSKVIKTVSITMRTPGSDEDLAAGFLFTEGIIQKREQVSGIKLLPYEVNKIKVILKDNEIPRLKNSERNFYTTSSCGVCGKTSIDSIKTVSVFDNIKDHINIEPKVLYSLNEELKTRQKIFMSTGGLHASALFDLNGKFEMLREDVGRHNALDKLTGQAFMNNMLPLNDKILLLSGRASFELIQKAVMAGIRIVAAVGAPSSLAVKLAEEFGVTLIGFLKSDRFNVYSGANRLITD